MYTGKPLTAPAAADASGSVPVVFVADRDRSVCESVFEFCLSEGWEVRALGSPGEFLAQPRGLFPRCLVTDLHLSDLAEGGLNALMAEWIGVPIIFLAERIDVCGAVRAMKAGAFEVLTKPIATDGLLSTIRYAIESSRAAQDQMAQRRRIEERYGLLSPREREVLDLVVCGRLNKQVAGELGITEFTVKAHRRRMMRKMRAKSLAELVTMAAGLRRRVAGARRDTSLLRDRCSGEGIARELPSFAAI
jgi:FixJ family two-component response regulator